MGTIGEGRFHINTFHASRNAIVTGGEIFIGQRKIFFDSLFERSTYKGRSKHQEFSVIAIFPPVNILSISRSCFTSRHRRTRCSKSPISSIVKTQHRGTGSRRVNIPKVKIIHGSTGRDPVNFHAFRIALSNVVDLPAGERRTRGLINHRGFSTPARHGHPGECL